MFSDQKVVLAGNTLHYYQYSKPIKYDFTQPQKIKRFQNAFQEEPVPSFDGHQYRARKNVRLLLQSNAWQWLAEGTPIRPIFITFTFKECETSLKRANKDFGDFTKRFNYAVYGSKCSRLKWLSVPEFQKRGAVHYHTIYFNLPHNELSTNAHFDLSLYKKASQSWDQGYIFVEPIDKLDILVNYVSKYFTKSKSDVRYANEKKYFTSRGLEKPREYRNPSVVQTLLTACDTPHYHKEFKSNFISTIYQCYTLPEKLKSFSLAQDYSLLPLLV
jgi:hypothetical protein